MMATIELEKSPSTMGLYYRAVTAKKPGKLQGDVLPLIKAHLRGVAAEPKKLAGYRKVCGFPASGSLPVTYPHILAFPLHMEILVNPLFPFPLLGLVHVRNEITQYRAIGNQELMDIECELSGPVVAAKGLEFSIITRVSIAGKLVWESVSTNLFRTKTKLEERRSKQRDTFSPDHITYWSVADNTGRRYARVSGDSNPIHLYAITAKMFGFKRHIAHGMWSKARSLAELDDQLPTGPFRVTINFKMPIFLPAKVQFQYANTGDTIEFRVKTQGGERPHLEGHIEIL